ncbi:wax ester/triacylglycerol synthase domain-containing protein [Nocardia anaemiae]|uniref:wax ester/triacylglycerol synthase domain-containing protein n=1 Tax=Nocardia anaemiae TaxID=263910 RepID=UPI0014722355|nr:wax ester/triacylglycerol synthase domain-containing protein [Nocardia anaemiae]
MTTVAAQDATMYWLSGRTRNDLFMLYCFDDSGHSGARLREFVARRSADIADLSVRLRALPADLDYPTWVRCEFRAEQFVEHFLPEPDWPGVCAVLGKLLGTGVDAAVRPWRLHVFRGVLGAPAGAGPAMVVVLQMSHALADGRRGADIARALFSEVGAAEPVAEGESLAWRSPVARAERTEGVAEAVTIADVAAHGDGVSGVGADSIAAPRRSVARRVAAQTARLGAAAVEAVPVDPIHVHSMLALLRMPIQFARTAIRGYQAFRAQQELVESTTAGRLPGPGPSFTPSPVNRSDPTKQHAHQVRMIVCDAERLRIPGHTVTVVALTAVSIALDRYLTARGERVNRLGAQVPMALSDNGIAARNNYRSLGVDLFIDEPEVLTRANKIAAALADRRTRAQHPLLTAQDRVTAVTPARLLRRDIERYPLDIVPDSIAGHTVVSSVHRGPADLTFGGAPVRFTGGFPAIGSVMHLTHGVHGLGDTVTVSIHADTAALPDIDIYANLLRDALNEVFDCATRSAS